MSSVTAGIFLVITCVDMGIKQYIEEYFKENEERKTMVNKLVIRKVYNRGFALDSLEKYPALVKGGSVIAGIGAVIYNARLFLKKGHFTEKLGMAFLSAGAFSNICDRLVRGKVIDYIGVDSKNRFLSKITANLADVYVFAGAVIVTLAKWIRK